MSTNTLLRNLGDAELLSATTSLVKRSNTVTAELLLHLGELDSRKLYLERAYPSLFAFCVGALGLSEDATCNLVTVARAARQHPAVLDALRSGSVHLTGLRILAPHLDATNADAVLKEASGRSKRDIEVLAARLAPKPPVPDSIRKLPRSAAPAEAPPETTTGSLFHVAPPPMPELHAAAPTPAAASTPPPLPVAPPRADAAPPRRTTLKPLSGGTFKVQFTASHELRDKLLEAQALLRHAVPDGELAAIIERAVDCLITEVKKKRFGTRPAGRQRGNATATDGSVAPAAPGHAISRHVPMELRRAVFQRDGGQCTFADAAGRRCAERGGLELDHIDGFARTHEHSVEGLRVRCRAHNQYAADLLYGREFMDRARARAPSAPGRIDAPGRTASAPGRIDAPGPTATVRAGAD